MLPTKFWFIWPSRFRIEDIQKSTNQKQELPVAAILVNESGRNEQSLQRTFHRCFLPRFGSFGQAVSEKEIFFRNRPIRNKNCLWWPCLFRNRAEMNNIYRGPSIHVYASQVSVHLAEQFHRRRFFRNQPIRNKNCLWRPHLLMVLPQMLPTTFRFIWLSGFRGEDFFRNQPIKNKN